jgi:hypothetical protein
LHPAIFTARFQTLDEREDRVWTAGAPQQQLKPRLV